MWNETCLEMNVTLTASVYLRYEQLHGLNEENIGIILTYYTHAKETDDSCYKAWHAYAYMNFEAILFYKDKSGPGEMVGGQEECTAATPSKRKVKWWIIEPRMY